jgi:modulator of FtsH protease HflC
MTFDGKRHVTAVILVAFAASVILLVARCLFTVETSEYVVVTAFGNPVRVIKTPGLQFKYPHQSVTRFDNRLFILIPPLSEFLTLEKTTVVASSMILWRIADPKRFLQTVFDSNGAASRLSDILFAALGVAIGRHPLSAFMSTAADAYQAEAILATVAARCREIALRDYGIAVVDIRLQQLDFPVQNRGSVFSRMKSERMRISMQFRSEGEEEGLKIRASADREKATIMAEALKVSQKARGEGEAQAARIYAESLSTDPAFYTFLRTLETYRKSLDKQTTMVLPLDSELFRLLSDSTYYFRSNAPQAHKPFGEKGGGADASRAVTGEK